MGYVLERHTGKQHFSWNETVSILKNHGLGDIIYPQPIVDGRWEVEDGDGRDTYYRPNARRG